MNYYSQEVTAAWVITGPPGMLVKSHPAPHRFPITQEGAEEGRRRRKEREEVDNKAPPCDMKWSQAEGGEARARRAAHAESSRDSHSHRGIPITCCLVRVSPSELIVRPRRCGATTGRCRGDALGRTL